VTLARRLTVRTAAWAAAAWTTATGTLWISGGLGAEMLHHKWPHASAADVALLVSRLIVGGDLDPSRAWPSPDQGLLPRPALYYSLLGAIGVPIVAIIVITVASFRRPVGSLAWSPPRLARPGFASRAEVRRLLDGRAARRTSAPLAARIPAPSPARPELPPTSESP
jgi:hypothetical protein